MKTNTNSIKVSEFFVYLVTDDIRVYIKTVLCNIFKAKTNIINIEIAITSFRFIFQILRQKH